MKGAEPGWSARNRWGLVALPFALVVALAGSSDRVHTYFWEGGLHQPVKGTAQQWVTFENTYTDREGDHQRRVRVRLDAVSATNTPWNSTSTFELPAGTKAIKVDLSLAAAPELEIRTCRLALRDAAGNRYEYLNNLAGGGQPLSPCVPEDAPGPFALFGSAQSSPDPDEKPRPQSWSVSPVIVLPENVTVTEVDLWWETPAYLALELSDSPG